MAVSKDEKDYFFDLVFEPSHTFTYEIANYAVEDLKKIGINATVEGGVYFWGPPSIPAGSDCLFDSMFWNLFISPYNYFTDKGYWGEYPFSYNEFPYTTPYMNESMEKVKNFMKGTNIQNILSGYQNRQELVMDRILFVIPLFDIHRYAFTWRNLNGFNFCWGISDSLPYMSFLSKHLGQERTDVLNLYYEFQSLFSLNPMHEYFWRDSIFTFYMEPLIKLTPENVPTKRGLIEDWSCIDKNHYVFKMRDNVFWAPSYNITEYDVILGNPPLMTGLKDNTASTGNNKKVTAHDAVFTLLFNAKAESSYYNRYLPYINKIYIDSNDNLTFHMELDFDAIPDNDNPHDLFWEDMQVSCLPEFFLNSTNTSISYSSGEIPFVGIYDGISNSPQWTTYPNSPFGCGKYRLDHYKLYDYIYLAKNQNWHGIGAIDGNYKEPQIEYINFSWVPKEDAFVSGKIDIIDFLAYPAKFFEENYGNTHFSYYTKPSNYQYFMVFNLYNQIIGGEQNKENLTVNGKEEYSKALAIRKAIAYTINRGYINCELFGGTYSLSQSIVPACFPSWLSNTYKYEYNLDKAWEWMEAAGYKREDFESFETKRTSLYFLSFFSLLYIISILRKRRRERCI